MLLRNRSLAGILIAELISLTGSQMTFVALPWFVLATTGSAAKMGYVLAAELVPVALLGIPSGSLIGRLGAKRTMLLSDACRAPLMALIPILHWTGGLSFPALLAITFAIGCFQAPYYGSSRSILPETFGDDERVVAQASGLIQAIGMTTGIAGPVLGGVLIAAFGPPSVLVVDAATYLVSFVVLGALVRGGKRLPADQRSKGVLAGIRFVLRDRLLGPMMLTAAFINFVGQALLICIPVLAFRRYDHDSHLAGIFFACFGVGALGGSLVVMKLATKVPLLRLAGTAIVAMGLPLWLLPIHMPAAGVAATLTLFGFFNPMVNAPLFGIISTRAPAALRPKVLTAVMTCAQIAGPLGFVVGGAAVQAFGLSPVFLASAIGFAVGSVAFWFVTRREARLEAQTQAQAAPAAAT